MVRIPEHGKLDPEKNGWEEWDRRFITNYKATLCFCSEKEGGQCEEAMPSVQVEFPKMPYWGALVAALVTLVGWALMAALLHFGPGAQRKPAGKSSSWAFSFAVTPSNRYSLAAVNALLWTLVTAFGVVFVWVTAEKFLEITPQVLALVGIGGGTTVVSLYQGLPRWRQIPLRFQKMVSTSNTPRFCDLISDGNQPSIAKVQSLFFTVVVACIVMKEILEKHAFPPLPDGIAILIGISSAAHLFSQSVPSESAEALKARMDALETRLQEHENEKKARLTEADDIKTIGDPELEREVKEIVDAINRYVA